MKKLIFIALCGALGVLLLAFAAEQFNILHGGPTAQATGMRALILRDSYIIVGALAGFAVWWWLDDDDDD